jgi:hypothetical protein
MNIDIKTRAKTTIILEQGSMICMRLNVEHLFEYHNNKIFEGDRSHFRPIFLLG